MLVVQGMPEALGDHHLPVYNVYDHSQREGFRLLLSREHPPGLALRPIVAVPGARKSVCLPPFL